MPLKLLLYIELSMAALMLVAGVSYYIHRLRKQNRELTATLGLLRASTASSVQDDSESDDTGQSLGDASKSLADIDSHTLSELHTASMDAMQQVVDDPDSGLIEQYRANISKLLARRGDTEKYIQKLEQQLERARKALEVLEFKLNQRTAKGKHAGSERESYGQGKSSAALAKKLEAMEDKLELKTRLLSQLKEDMSSALKEKSEYLTQIERLKRKLKQLNETMDRAMREKEFLEAVFLETDAQASESESLRTELQRVLGENQQLLEQLNQPTPSRPAYPIEGPVEQVE